MDKNQQPWSVKGVEPEAREAAKLAARRAGMTLGAWLNRVIRSAAVEDLAGNAKAGSPASDPPQLPALPIDALLEAIREHTSEIKKAVEENTDRLDALDALDKLDKLDKLDRLDKLEGLGRLDGLRKLEHLEPTLDKLEKAASSFGSLGDLPQRVAEAEAKAQKAALAVGPLERTVVRLSERLNPVEELPQGERRRGFLSRLFGG